MGAGDSVEHTGPVGRKTEPPSKRHMRRARQRGVVAQSRILTAAVAMAAVAASLLWAGPMLADQLARIIRGSVPAALEAGEPREIALRAADLAPLAGAVGYVLLAFLLLGLAAAGLAAALQTSALWAPKAVAPAWQRIHPKAGFARIGSTETLAALAVCGLKIALIATLCWDLLARHASDIARLAELPVARSAQVAATLVMLLLARVIAALLGFGAIDVLWQRYRLWRALMMTREQKHREWRETHGSPERRAQQRRVHAELLVPGHRRSPTEP